MATIAICVWPLPSSLLNAVSLAKRLRRRGHRVCLISSPDGESYARAEDIEFVTVLADVLPAGSLVERPGPSRRSRDIALLREIRRITRHTGAIIDDLLASEPNEIERAFEQVDPDLVLLFSDTPLIGGRRHDGAAAGDSLRLRDAALLSPSRPFLATALERPRAAHGGVEPLVGAAGLGALPPGQARLRAPRRRARSRLRPAPPPSHAVAVGRAGRVGRSSGTASSLPMLHLPEFLLTPRELDFPIEPRNGTHYLGWAVDDVRPEEPYPWERLDPSRPLVYCSLGTLLYLPLARQRAFLQAVIDALAARPHLQLALATGGYVSPAELGGARAGCDRARAHAPGPGPAPRQADDHPLRLQHDAGMRRPGACR